MEVIAYWTLFVVVVAAYRLGIYKPGPVPFHCVGCSNRATRRRWARGAVVILAGVAVYTHWPVHPDWAFLTLAALQELT